MKPETFVILFCLLFAGTYVAWTQRTRFSSNTVSMTISSGDYYEEIKYAGKIVLNEEETGIATMSQGSYLKYTINDNTLQVEQNDQQQLVYQVNDDRPTASLSINDNKLVTEAIHEMIAWGFDARPRMERLYAKGGSNILLNEFRKLKAMHVKVMYLNKVLQDSLITDSVASMLQLTASLESDRDKGVILKQITAQQLTHSSARDAFFATLNSMTSDGDRLSVFTHLVQQGMLTNNMFGAAIGTAARTGSDHEKMFFYKTLLTLDNITNDQWMAFLHAVDGLHSNADKSELLIAIAGKMPANEALKKAYIDVVSTIKDDAEYARVMRQVK